MSSKIDLYGYVMARLRAKSVPQKQVAEGAGVPFSTVAKIAQGVVTDPSVHTVQRLYDYFLSHESRAPTGQPSLFPPPVRSPEPALSHAKECL